MSILELTPAYGRDYPSRKAVLEAWNDDQDFLVANVELGATKPINKSGSKDLPASYKWINIRYKNLREVAVIDRVRLLKQQEKAPKVSMPDDIRDREPYTVSEPDGGRVWELDDLFRRLRHNVDLADSSRHLADAPTAEVAAKQPIVDRARGALEQARKLIDELIEKLN
jgi:hypothetical protein